MADRIKLSYDEAVALLPDGDDIHTFINPGGMLIGADWRRQQVLDILKTGSPELSGQMATDMGHGIVAWREVDEEKDWVKDPVFISTKASDSVDDTQQPSEHSASKSASPPNQPQRKEQ